MKNIFKSIFNYIKYITKPEPLNLFATFCRILVYCVVIMDLFFLKRIIVGCLILFINVCSSLMTVCNYNLNILNSESGKNNFIINDFKKIIKKNNVKPVKKDKSLSVEEKIAALKLMSESYKEAAKMIDEEIEKLNKKGENHENK